MAEYHVGCGVFGIYAGTLNKKKDRYVPVWVEYLPLNNGTSQIFAGYVDANSLLGNSVSFISSKPQNYFQKGDQIRFWDSYPTEQERDTAPWGRREKP